MGNNCKFKKKLLPLKYKQYFCSSNLQSSISFAQGHKNEGTSNDWMRFLVESINWRCSLIIILHPGAAIASSYLKKTKIGRNHLAAVSLFYFESNSNGFPD